MGSEGENQIGEEKKANEEEKVDEVIGGNDEGVVKVEESVEEKVEEKKAEADIRAKLVEENERLKKEMEELRRENAQKGEKDLGSSGGRKRKASNQADFEPSGNRKRKASDQADSEPSSAQKPKATDNADPDTRRPKWGQPGYWQAKQEKKKEAKKQKKMEEEEKKKKETEEKKKNDEEKKKETAVGRSQSQASGGSIAPALRGSEGPPLGIPLSWPHERLVEYVTAGAFAQRLMYDEWVVGNSFLPVLEDLPRSLWHEWVTAPSVNDQRTLINRIRRQASQEGAEGNRGQPTLPLYPQPSPSSGPPSGAPTGPRTQSLPSRSAADQGQSSGSQFRSNGAGAYDRSSVSGRYSNARTHSSSYNYGYQQRPLAPPPPLHPASYYSSSSPAFLQSLETSSLYLASPLPRGSRQVSFRAPVPSASQSTRGGDVFQRQTAVEDSLARLREEVWAYGETTAKEKEEEKKAKEKKEKEVKEEKEKEVKVKEEPEP